MNRAQWTLALTVLVASIDAQAQAPVPLAVEVSLNGEARGTVLVLQRGAEFLIGAEDARLWRLRRPDTQVVDFRGQAFYPLSALGLSVLRLDPVQQQLDLRAEPSAFEDSTEHLNAIEFRLTPAAWGGFATYDFLGTRVDGQSALDGAFTASAFGPYGSLSYQFVERNLWSTNDAERESVRIATTFRRDWAEALMSLEAGDTLSRPGAFGRALRFGGIAVGTNFALRPGFIRQPLPDLSGETSLPSTVEVFVQNQLRSVTQVPAGRFTLDNVPVILGAGDARVVVRDALGREQVITSSFYVAGGLLRQGLSEWFVGAGKLREDFGDDTSYGQNYANGLIRYGLTNSVTVEARAEYESDRTRVLGGAIDVGGRWGEVEATGGMADVQGVGARWLWGLGYRYVTLDYNIGVRWVEAQRGFRQPGETFEDPTPARAVTAIAGAQLTSRWSAGVGWIEVERQRGWVTRSANASATYSLQHGASLLFGYNRVSEGGMTRQIGSVILSMSLGPQTAASAGFDFGSERRQFASVQRALPFDEGWGYRAGVNHFSNRTRVDAGAALNLPVATIAAEVVDEAGLRPAGRVGLAGSLAVIEDKMFAARPINDSFALVRIPGVPDAPIYLNNQFVGLTDNEGRLVLPRMSAYVPNQVSVDVDALPPDAEITRDRETVVPPYRSGVVVGPAVRRTASALVKVVDPNGRIIGAGSSVSVEPDGSATSIAQGGAFFVRAQPGPKRATITERGERCVIEFEVKPADVGAYRTLGPFTCVR